MISCKECGKEISSDASACPHCGYKRSRGSGKVLLICLAALVVCGTIIFIQKSTESPLAGTGLKIGQQIVLSSFLPGCKSLEHFKVYTDLTEAEIYHGEDSDCAGMDKGTQLQLVDADLMSTKTVEDVKVVKTVVSSGPNKGQTFWCTVENLASVTPGANY